MPRDASSYSQRTMRKAAKLLYRIAAILFLLFAAGHTAGFLTFHPATAEAIAVQEGMRRVGFEFSGNTATWYGLFTGFGLFVSGYQLFTAFLAWRLSRASGAEVAMARSLGWALFGMQVVNLALCVRYFGSIQVIFATMCAATVGAAALQTRPAPE
jgi:hypothetical protein